MLRSLKDFEHYGVNAIDGDIGSVKNFLLDDKLWIIRYLVVQTGGFLEGHDVLISPISFRRTNGSSRRFHLTLTMDKVKNSPGVDADKPVSRQHERDYYKYYGYPHYWGNEGAWGMGAFPGQLAVGAWEEDPAGQSDKAPDDIHLRSAVEVRGYHIHGTDGAVGHVEDFIVNDKTWEVRYLVIDTSNWWFGKKVLVSPHWATRISWEEHNVHVNMTRQMIKDSPEWDPASPINRKYEERLYDYYGRPVYWTLRSHSSDAQAPSLPVTLGR